MNAEENLLIVSNNFHQRVRNFMFHSIPIHVSYPEILEKFVRSQTIALGKTLAQNV